MYGDAANSLVETRMPEPIPVFGSAVRAASQNSQNYKTNWKGLKLVIDVTAVPGVDTVTFAIEGYDPVSGKYVTILDSPAIVATGTTVLSVYPGMTAAANSVANDVMWREFRVSVTHSGAGNFTYSTTAIPIP